MVRDTIKYLLFTNGYGNIWENAKLHSSRDEFIEGTSYTVCLTLSLRRHLYNAPSCYTEHHKI